MLGGNHKWPQTFSIHSCWYTCYNYETLMCWVMWPTDTLLEYIYLYRWNTIYLQVTEVTWCLPFTTVHNITLLLTSCDTGHSWNIRPSENLGDFWQIESNENDCHDSAIWMDYFSFCYAFLILPFVPFPPLPLFSMWTNLLWLILYYDDSP